MRKISGQVLSTKPVSLARAAKLVSRFASVDNGSSSAVSLYLHRTAEAFNHLVQFHNKRKTADLENSPDRKRVQNSQTDRLEKNPGGKEAQDGKSRGKRERKAETGVAEENPFEDEVRDSKIGAEEQMMEKKKKKKKKERESDGVDLEGKSNSKKSSKKSRRHEGLDS